jgi:hypothetical protein
MATRVEVENFLNNFKEKMKIWDVVFRDDRGKNFQTLIDLELSAHERKIILQDLQAGDYSDGPLKDKLNNGTDMWIFGRVIKKREVYIKIALGAFNASTICISFHIAEQIMRYPLN